MTGGRGGDPLVRVAQAGNQALAEMWKDVLRSNGIPSMRKRATTFGGKLHIESEPGSGTRVTLEASVRRVPK